MPISGKQPKFFRIKRYLPQNRVQQQKIAVPQPVYRPIRMERRDVVIRGLLKETSDWFTLHRRNFPGIFVKVDDSDPDERRAVSKQVIKGTLPERIVYLELIRRKYIEGLDFTFQSSTEGGRNELGGIVVDFLFEFLRIALEIQGPTHDTHIQKAKDNEKESTLASMGFTMLRLDTDVIDNPNLLEAWFRQYLDPGSVSILDPFDTYVDEPVSY
jgi:very-short-patch-repair endonuclease